VFNRQAWRFDASIDISRPIRSARALPPPAPLPTLPSAPLVVSSHSTEVKSEGRLQKEVGIIFWSCFSCAFNKLPQESESQTKPKPRIYLPALTSWSMPILIFPHVEIPSEMWMEVLNWVDLTSACRYVRHTSLML
jgi:hypothetical protein